MFTAESSARFAVRCSVLVVLLPLEASSKCRHHQVKEHSTVQCHVVILLK
jgi:hypothetical protein